MCIYILTYTKQIAEYISSVLVRLALDIIFAFYSDTLALNTLFDLGDKTVHVLLVSADKRDGVPGLAPSRVTVYSISISTLWTTRLWFAHLPTLIPSGSTFLANSVK